MLPFESKLYLLLYDAFEKLVIVRAFDCGVAWTSTIISNLSLTMGLIYQYFTLTLTVYHTFFHFRYIVSPPAPPPSSDFLKYNLVAFGMNLGGQ